MSENTSAPPNSYRRYFWRGIFYFLCFLSGLLLWAGYSVSSNGIDDHGVYNYSVKGKLDDIANGNIEGLLPDDEEVMEK